MSYEYGDAFTPVFLATETGDDPQAVYSTSAYYVQPCRHPWEIPVGVLETDAVASGECTVRTSGTFDVFAGDICLPTPAGLPSHRDRAVGMRVYYDQDMYCVPSHTTLRESHTYIRGSFPGAATIGYIEAYNADTGKFRVRIDPRPPTATYAVAAFGSTVTEAMIGKSCLITGGVANLVASEQDTFGAYGVVAGSTENTTEYAVICLRGPAWYRVDPTKIYIHHTAVELAAAGTPPSNAQITVAGAVAPFDLQVEYTTIGRLDWPAWYTGNALTNAAISLMHVQPSKAYSIIQPGDDTDAKTKTEV